jgi:regulatory protein
LQEEVDKARSYALRLFKFRPRAEKELVARLKKRKFSELPIDKVVCEFKQLGLIDDVKFVQDWVSARRQKGFGRRRIEFELQQKGIEKELLEENTNLHSDEYALALKIAGKQKETLLTKNLEIHKIKQRLFNFLMRRGFSPDTTREVIEEIL